MAGTRADDRGAGSYVGRRRRSPASQRSPTSSTTSSSWPAATASSTRPRRSSRTSGTTDSTGTRPAPFNEIYGAAHAFDLPFIFDATPTAKV